MLATHHPRKPAWALACGRVCLRFGGRPNAFGNALGQGFVDSMRPTQGVGAYAAVDYRNEMAKASDNAYYDRVIGQSLSRPSSGLTDTSTDAEVMAYQMREAGFNGDMVPTAGNGLSLGSGKAAYSQNGRTVIIDGTGKQSSPYRVEISGVGSTDPDLYNQDLINTAIRRGESLSPTLVNARRLGLVDQTGQPSVYGGASGDYGSISEAPGLFANLANTGRAYLNNQIGFGDAMSMANGQIGGFGNVTKDTLTGLMNGGIGVVEFGVNVLGGGTMPGDPGALNFPKFGYTGRTAELGPDIAMMAPMLLGVRGGRNSAAELGSAERTTGSGKTVTLYRVDDAGFAPRIAADGSVPVVTTGSGSERALFVNIGQPLRAKEFALINRNGNATVTAVDVNISLLEELRATSVYDKSAAVKLNPTAPLRVDINKAPDQFGLRTPQQIQMLRDAINPSTVRIIDPKTLR